jgi:ribosome-binding factor A
MNEPIHGSKREKLGEAIREQSAMFIERESNNTALITVTRVEVDDRLKKAIIFVTVMPDSKKDEALSFLRRLRGDLHHFLLKSGRIPRPPTLDIVEDVGEKHRQNIERIIKEVGM